MNLQKKKNTSNLLFYKNSTIYDFDSFKIRWIFWIEIPLIAVTLVISIILGDLLQGIFFYAVPSILLFLYLRRKKISLRIWFQPIERKAYGELFLCYLFFVGFRMSIILLNAVIFEKGDKITYYNWKEVLIYVFLAPVVEELIFRGFILQKFLSKYALWKAVLFASLTFMICHLNPQNLIALPFGIVLSILMIRHSNVIITILIHMLWNASIYLQAYPLTLFSEQNQNVRGIGLLLAIGITFVTMIPVLLICIKTLTLTNDDLSSKKDQEV